MLNGILFYSSANNKLKLKLIWRVWYGRARCIEKDGLVHEKYGMKRGGVGMNDDIKAMVPSITHHFASLWPRTDRTTFS